MSRETIAIVKKTIELATQVVNDLESGKINMTCDADRLSAGKILILARTFLETPNIATAKMFIDNFKY